MIRHGQASFGSVNYDRLSETGRLQSRLLAEHLLALGFAPDALYTGSMERQKGTAEATVALFREQGIALPEQEIDEAFNEYSSRRIILAYVEQSGDPSLKEDLGRIREDRKAFQRIFEGILMAWMTGTFRSPGIATWEEFRERVLEGLGRVIARNGRGRTIAVFTSGGPISAALQEAMGLTNERTLQTAWQIANGSVTKFLYNGERITLAAFNGTEHLALKRDPSLITYR